jgi:cobalt/nickel transport system permease protein
MTIAFRNRPVPDSPLSRWDARWKLAAVLVAVGAVASLDRPAPAAAALALGLLMLAVARLSWNWLRGRLSVLAFAALPFLLVLPFTLPGEGWELAGVSVSERGLTAGTAVFCRCLAVGCLSLVLVGTAPLHHTLAAAHKLKVPGLLVQLTLLAYRYTFLLADEMKRLRVAMRTRGFRVEATRHGYRALGHATGAVLVRGADQAERVAAAMRCRGFDGGFHTLSAFRTTAADMMGCAALVAAVAALVLWDRLLP